MLFFGSLWPRDPWRTFIGPPALMCLCCDKPVTALDSGVVMPAVDAEGEYYSCAYHRQCLLETLGLVDDGDV